MCVVFLVNIHPYALDAVILNNIGHISQCGHKLEASLAAWMVLVYQWVKIELKHPFATELLGKNRRDCLLDIDHLMDGWNLKLMQQG